MPSRYQPPKKITIALRPSEIALLTEALDSHAYWQLSDDDNRNNGYVLDESESVDLKRCTRLQRKLEKIGVKP